MMGPISPIRRFLAISGRESDPFTLLGVDPQACDAQAVQDALERRLGRIARHPESLSHEADEVRLALHAAAAQLLDPDVRAQLASLRAQDAPASAGPSTAGAGGGGALAAPTPFEDMAVRVLARCGGWNADARRWLAGLCHAFGVSERELPAILRRIAARGAARRHQDASRLMRPPAPSAGAGAGEEDAKAARPAASRPAAMSHEDEPTPPLWLRLLVPGTFVAALLVAALVFLALPGSPRGGSGEDDRASGQAQDPAAAAAPSPFPSRREADGAPARRAAEAVRAASLQPPRPPAEILAWLREAVEVFPEAPGDAAWRFDRAVTDLARSWIHFESPALGQAHEYVLDFAHLATPDAESARRAVEALASPLDAIQPEAGPLLSRDVVPAVWSAGMLARLGGERELPGRLLQEVGAHLARAVGRAPEDEAATFIAGAEAALDSIASRLARRSPGPADAAGDAAVDAWRRWRIAAHAAATFGAWRGAWMSGAESAERDWLDRVTLAGAERLVREDAPSMRAGARDALIDLLQHVRWSPGDATPPLPAWRAVIAWFDEESIATPDLAVVTEWVVSESDAPGVDLRMTLSRAAGPAARSLLRDRYARAWGLEAQPASGVSSMWRRAAQSALNAVPRPGSGSVIERLSQAARYARLNEASSRRWRGQTNIARDLLLNLDRPIDQARSQAARTTAHVRDHAPAADGEWAVRFIDASNNADARAQLLVELDRRGGRLGPIDAETLVEAALWGVPAPVRDRAQRVVRRRRDDAAIHNGLLEALPRAPQTPSISGLIEDVTGRRLPPVNAEDWPRAARRALVETLLPALTGVDAIVAVDAISGVIARAYDARAGEGARVTIESPERLAADVDLEAGAGAADDAAHLWTAWRRAALRYLPNTRAPDSLVALERRRAARLRLARGPLSRFAADQVSAAEMMAHVIIAERPSRADLVKALLDAMSEGRELSVDLVDQVLLTERTMLALWAVRLGEEDLAPRTGQQDAAGDET